MSEYQYIQFLAVDRMLGDEQLRYMERQSSHAKVNRQEFVAEYHYGDFGGNASEMLRRGYDAYMHYADFGVRTLMFRFPQGLPEPAESWAPYLTKDGVRWHADKTGPGGILQIEPYGEISQFEDFDVNLNGLLKKIAPVRDMLMRGDWRPLYLAWLACCGDDDTLEPPVPAGLGALPKCMTQMAHYLAVDEELLRAAAQASPPAPSANERAEPDPRQWLEHRSIDELRALLLRVLTDDPAAVRVEMLASIRSEMKSASWPTAEPTRTLGQLRDAAEAMRNDVELKKVRAQEAKRRKQLSAIAADPKRHIAKAESLVQKRSAENYDAAAQMLADLREALGPVDGPREAELAAQNLVALNPKLPFLVAALRRHGLLPKSK